MPFILLRVFDKFSICLSQEKVSSISIPKYVTDLTDSKTKSNFNVGDKKVMFPYRTEKINRVFNLLNESLLAASHLTVDGLFLC